MEAENSFCRLVLHLFTAWTLVTIKSEFAHAIVYWSRSESKQQRAVLHVVCASLPCKILILRIFASRGVMQCSILSRQIWCGV